MSPINRTPGASEAISPRLENPELVGNLRDRNIWEILTEYTKEDVLDFIKFQAVQYQDILQNEKTMSLSAETLPPDHIMPVEMNPDFALSSRDLAELGAMFSEVGEGAGGARMSAKAAVAPKASEGAGGGKSSLSDEVDHAQGLLSEADEWYTVLEDKMFDIQCQIDMEKQSKELKEEIQKLISLARSGGDVSFLLLAIAKVNVSKNGLLFTQKGKELVRLNDEATKVTNSIMAVSTDDPKFYAQSQMANVKTREINTQTTFLTNDMSKITSNIESVMSWAGRGINDLANQKDKMIGNVKAG